MNGKRKSAAFQSVIIPCSPEVLEESRHVKRARLQDGSHAQELDIGSESPPAFSPETSEIPHQKTLRSGRTWVPTPLHELEPGRVRKQREVVSSAASASSISISSPDTVSPMAKKIKKIICGPSISSSRVLQDRNGREAPRKSYGQTKDVPTFHKPPVTFPTTQPRSNYLGLQNAKVTLRQANNLPVERFKNTPSLNERIKEARAPGKLTATERKSQDRKLENEKIALRKSRSLSMATSLSELVDIHNRSRGVQSICADRFKWKTEFWSGYFKQTAKVLILAPASTSSGSETKKGKKKSLGQTDWSVKFELDALELCILSNGGDIPTRSSDWLESYASEKFTCVFIHRACVEEIFDQAKSSLYQMTSQDRPRIQFFEFGTGASSPSPMVELILKGGAIMIPTIDSLIKSAEQSDKNKSYHRLRDANKTNPYLRIFLPRMEAPGLDELEKIPVKDSIELLDNFYFMNNSIDVPLEEFVLSTKIGVRLLNETFGKEDTDEYYFDEDNPEIKEIVAALLVIRKRLRKRFRRYIILVDNSSPLLKKPDHRIFSGIEVMSIEEGCKLAETSGF